MSAAYPPEAARAAGGSSGVTCPVCQLPALAVAPEPGWGAWHWCPQCTLQFVQPMRLPQPPTCLYDAAYQGRVEVAGMREYRERVVRQEFMLSRNPDPTAGFWSQAFGDTLASFRAALPVGATVLEVGCALGWFMLAARDAGFDVVGLDVAETVVSIAHERGFRAWHGDLTSLPADFVRPSGIASFFVLHHLPDPLGWLRELRMRFPDSVLVVAAHGHGESGERADGRVSAPPRTLSRWNERSLRALFLAAGYEVEVRSYSSSGAGSPRLAPLHRLMQRLLRWPALFRAVKRLERVVAPVLYRGLRQEGAELLVFGRARSGPTT